MKKTSLLLGSILSFVISIVHIAAIVIGPAAYNYLDAPELAELTQTGSWIPAILTFGMALVFGLFSLYALSAINIVRKLPFVTIVIPCIGAIYCLRGLAIIWFIWLVVIDSPSAIPREIVFSLMSLITGVCYVYPSLMKERQ